MVSKCANPECCEVFRYLHQGKIFHLFPTPAVQAAAEVLSPLLCERFWLCDKCSKEMTVVWGGTQAKLVGLPSETAEAAPFPLLLSQDGLSRGRLKGRAAAAGRDEG